MSQNDLLHPTSSPAGQAVAIVDADPQSTATMILGLKPVAEPWSSEPIELFIKKLAVDRSPEAPRFHAATVYRCQRCRRPVRDPHIVMCGRCTMGAVERHAVRSREVQF